MNGKRYAGAQARKNGFYLALAVCLVAVGIAAWSTYDAVHGYLETEAPVSGLTAAEDPEAPRPSPATNATQTPGAAATPTPAPTARPTATPKPTVKPVPTAAPKIETAAEEEEPETPETPVEPANAPLYEISREMIFPVGEGEVLMAYSAGAPVYSPTMKDWRIHIGTDFKAESGEQVLAAGNGQVKETYTDAMLGNVVQIEHGEYLFSYCGLGENFLVSPGDTVTMGQPIGTVTAAPSESAEEPHLHLETRRDGVCLDPEEVLRETH